MPPFCSTSKTQGKGTGPGVSGLQFLSVEKLLCCLLFSQRRPGWSLFQSLAWSCFIGFYLVARGVHVTIPTFFLLIWVFIGFDWSVLCPWTRLLSPDALRLLCGWTLSEMLASTWGGVYFKMCWLLAFLRGFESPTTFCFSQWTCVLEVPCWTGSWSHCLPKLLHADFSDENIA